MSAIYDAAKVAFLSKQINWVTDDIRACLVDTTVGTGGYTYSVAHTSKTDILGKIVADSSATLANKTISSAAVCDANDVTFPVVSGNSIEAIVLYFYTGVDATSTLIAYIDGFSVIQGTGNSVTVVWDNGTNKIFKF